MKLNQKCDGRQYMRHVLVTECGDGGQLIQCNGFKYSGIYLIKGIQTIEASM